MSKSGIKKIIIGVVLIIVTFGVYALLNAKK